MSDVGGERTRAFARELQQEARHASEALAFAIGAIAFVQLALLMAAAGVVAALWETHRIAAIVGVASLFAACGLACTLRLRARFATMAQGFPATRTILREDVARLRALRAGLGKQAGTASGAIAWLSRGMAFARFARSLAGLVSPGVRNRTDARR